jgi:hypothetical protein
LRRTLVCEAGGHRQVIVAIRSKVAKPRGLQGPARKGDVDDRLGFWLDSAGISDERAGERRLEAGVYVLRLVRRTGKTLGYRPPQHIIGSST